MARHYRIPCYSTAGVADSSSPGMQASIEKLFTHVPMAMSGAQYIHYAFGLLERTNIFCPAQAVLDNQHIGMIKMFLSQPKLGEEDMDKTFEQIKKVLGSKQKLYVRFTRKGLRDGSIYPHYPFEADGGDGVIEKALAKLDELLAKPVKGVSKEQENRIFNEVPGIVERLRK